MAKNAVIELVRGIIERYEDYIEYLFFEALRPFEDVVETIFCNAFPELPDDDESYYYAIDILREMIGDMSPAE